MSEEASTCAQNKDILDVLHPMQMMAQESPTRDIMNGCGRWQISVLDAIGFVALVDCMPRIVPETKTADYAIVQAARVSYGQGTKRVQEDEGLIRYLLRHAHTTPFEMVRFKFHCKMPIFVARQWIRHRTASINEYSARYSVVRDEFYHPDGCAIQKQATTNRQGGSGEYVDFETAKQFEAYLDKAEGLYGDYEALLQNGVAREEARIGLPLSTYTEFYWCIDLHNLLHFLRLRMDAHAQGEIRAYGRAIYRLIEPIVPLACQAFTDYRLESIQLSRLEVEALRNGDDKLKTTNAREQQEWEDKKKKLGLNCE